MDPSETTVSTIPDGARQCLLSSQSIDAPAINQDREDEVESLMSGIQLEDNCTTQIENARIHHLRNQQPASKKQKLNMETAKKHLKAASENVVVDNTLQEYRRCITIFLTCSIHTLT